MQVKTTINKREKLHSVQRLAFREAEDRREEAGVVVGLETVLLKTANLVLILWIKVDNIYFIIG